MRCDTRGIKLTQESVVGVDLDVVLHSVIRRGHHEDICADHSDDEAVKRDRRAQGKESSAEGVVWHVGRRALFGLLRRHGVHGVDPLLLLRSHTRRLSIGLILDAIE